MQQCLGQVQWAEGRGDLIPWALLGARHWGWGGGSHTGISSPPQPYEMGVPIFLLHIKGQSLGEDHRVWRGVNVRASLPDLSPQGFLCR